MFAMRMRVEHGQFTAIGLEPHLAQFGDGNPAVLACPDHERKSNPRHPTVANVTVFQNREKFRTYGILPVAFYYDGE